MCDKCFVKTGAQNSCARCNGPTSSDCTACDPGFYLQYNTGRFFGKCIKKDPHPPHDVYELLVSHRQQDRNIPVPEAQREGTEASPFTDLRSALHKANELAARYQSENVTITIYLSRGPHFITLSDEFYLERGVSEHFELNYNLIIQPLYSDNGLSITDPQLLTPDGQQVTIHNKIGAYFSIQVPLSLQVDNLVFDSLDSLSQWSLECLGRHSATCYLDVPTKSVSDVDGSQCGCAAPSDHSLNNCMAPTATSFFKFSYLSTLVTLPHPRKLTLTGCRFQNFFHPFNALIGIPTGASLVTIAATTFLRFSSCGSVVKNVSTPPEVKQRKIGPGNSYYQIPEDEDVYNLQTEDNGTLDPAFPNCPRRNDPQYAQDCHHLIIQSSSFHDFDYFFKTTMSLANTPNGMTLHFRKNQYSHYRAPLIHLESYEGFVRISDSNFTNIKHFRPECYYDSQSRDFSVSYMEQFFQNKTFSSSQFLKIENPIILIRINQGFWFTNNHIQESSGTKGFLYLTLKPTIFKPVLIEENIFKGVAGFYGSAVIQVTLVETEFRLESPDYEFTCGGLTLLGNKFQGSVSCNNESPTIRVDCTDDIYNVDYQEYSMQIKDLADWTSNEPRLVQDTTTLGFGGTVSGQVSLRSVVLESNTFIKTHRGEAASEIFIYHIPSVIIRDTNITLSSSLAFITQEFTTPFASTSLIPQFRDRLVGEPGSLIRIRQALWLEVSDLNVNSNLMSYRVNQNYAVLQIQAARRQIELSDFEITKLQSTNCSQVFSQIYSSTPSNCVASIATSVETPIIVLEKDGSKTSFTPSFSMRNVLLKDIIFEANGQGSALVTNDRDSQPRQMDYSYYNLTLLNIKAESNSAFRWRGNRFTLQEYNAQNCSFDMMLSTESSQKDQQVHSMTLKEIKVVDVQSRTLLRLDSFNSFEFQFSNSNPATHYFDSLKLNNQFLYVKRNLLNENVTAQLTNLSISNVKNTQPRTNSKESPLFFFTMGGQYILRNVNFASSPGNDLGQLLTLESSDRTTLQTYNLSFVNIDSTQSPISGPAIKIVGSSIQVAFQNNNFTGIISQNIEGGVISINGAIVEDFSPHYARNKARQGGVYHLMNTRSKLTIENAVFTQNEALLNGGAIFIIEG